MPPCSAAFGEQVGLGHHRGAADQGEGALTGAQGAHGEVQGDQGGGAGGVDGHRGPLQAERVRDPAGGDAAGRSGQNESLDLVEQFTVTRPVLLVGHADEDAAFCAPPGGGVESRPLQGFPGGLQQQPLLRVHRQRLARGDAEQSGVERTGVGEEAARQPEVPAELVGPPATVRGEPRDGVAAAVDELPQVLGGGDAAREPAGHRNDGDGLAGVCFQLLYALSGPLQVCGDPLEIVDDLVVSRHWDQLHGLRRDRRIRCR
ncbi:hypothetical protein SAVIM40S_00232 [Streptomyces avidinii]